MHNVLVVDPGVSTDCFWRYRGDWVRTNAAPHWPSLHLHSVSATRGSTRSAWPSMLRNGPLFAPLVGGVFEARGDLPGEESSPGRSCEALAAVSQRRQLINSRADSFKVRHLSTIFLFRQSFLTQRYRLLRDRHLQTWQPIA